MIALSSRAKKRLHDYLNQVRTSLRDSVTVDRDEVEHNVIEHIQNELANATQPISCDDLELVLTKLGSPAQWVPDEQIPWWRKIIVRLLAGPEDWRLAYISFGLLILAFFVGKPACFILVLASFCLSRAVLTMAQQPDELRGKKWLIYPSLIIVYVPLLCLLLSWPLLLLYGPYFGLGHHTAAYELAASPLTTYGSARNAALPILLTVVGLWWTVLGIIGCAALGLFKVIFRPFADNLKRRWPALLMLIGILLVLSCLAARLLSTGRPPYLTRYASPEWRIQLC